MRIEKFGECSVSDAGSYLDESGLVSYIKKNDESRYIASNTKPCLGSTRLFLSNTATYYQDLHLIFTIFDVNKKPVSEFVFLPEISDERLLTSRGINIVKRFDNILVNMTIRPGMEKNINSEWVAKQLDRANESLANAAYVNNLLEDHLENNLNNHGALSFI